MFVVCLKDGDHDKADEWRQKFYHSYDPLGDYKHGVAEDILEMTEAAFNHCLLHTEYQAKNWNAKLDAGSWATVKLLAGWALAPVTGGASLVAAFSSGAYDVAKATYDASGPADTQKAAEYRKAEFERAAGRVKDKLCH